MLLDDLFNVVGIDVLIPDSVRIDDEYRSLVASVHASRLVDADVPLALELELSDPILRVGLRLGGAQRITAAFAFGALVAAEKHVVFVIAHIWAFQLSELAVKRRYPVVVSGLWASAEKNEIGERHEGPETGGQARKTIEVQKMSLSPGGQCRG